MANKKEVALKANIKKPASIMLGPDGQYYQVNRLKMVKLKDKPNRGGVDVDLRTLGYIPDVIVVQKVNGEHDKLVISALVLQIKNKKEPKNEN